MSIPRLIEQNPQQAGVNLQHTELTPSYRIDLRVPNGNEMDRFMKADMVSDWSQLSWKDVGKPYEVKSVAKSKSEFEDLHGRMSVKQSWEFFNKSFHEWFVKDMPSEMTASRKNMLNHLKNFQFSEVKEALGETVRLSLWNYIHRIQDGVWDPRGKRALFDGLDVQKPKILFLGAAEGYEAMQLSAMYPNGEIVLCDYDEFCKTDRFGLFPETYPFLGANPATGQYRAWYKNDMNIEYIVEDIRDLPYGKEFDIVLSVGLLEHFPDEHKEEALEWHRKYLRPGGYAIMTTPRAQWKSKMFYLIMADVMNHTYRELMNIQQMGLYVYEGGFDILRHGYIKAHNGIVAKPR